MYIIFHNKEHVKKTKTKTSESEGANSQLETKATAFTVVSNKQVFHINIPSH